MAVIQAHSIVYACASYLLIFDDDPIKNKCAIVSAIFLPALKGW